MMGGKGEEYGHRRLWGEGVRCGDTEDDGGERVRCVDT